MAEDFKYDAFLSHSSHDKTTVRAVAERLRSDGLRIWLDDWELRPGDHIQAKIEEGLKHSRVLVLFMSAHAFGSDWARLESYTFRFRDPLNKQRRFIPLRLDSAPIEGSLEQLLYINWLSGDREQEYNKLLEACRPPSEQQAADAQDVPKQFAEKATRLSYAAKIRAYVFSLDGKRTLTGSDDYMVRLWDVETGRSLRVLEGHMSSVWSVAWSPDQRRALSGS